MTQINSSEDAIQVLERSILSSEKFEELSKSLTETSTFQMLALANQFGVSCRLVLSALYVYRDHDHPDKEAEMLMTSADALLHELDYDACLQEEEASENESDMDMDEVTETVTPKTYASAAAPPEFPPKDIRWS